MNDPATMTACKTGKGRAAVGWLICWCRLKQHQSDRKEVGGTVDTCLDEQGALPVGPSALL